MTATLAARTARRLGARLALGGAVSVVGGAAMAALGTTEAQRAFGLQSAGWGAIDLVIAGVGAVRPPPEDPAKLRKVLLFNAGLDVGYVATGAHLVYWKPTFDGRITAQQSVGHGAAIVVQGLFLLVLDSVYAGKVSPTRGASLTR